MEQGATARVETPPSAVDRARRLMLLDRLSSVQRRLAGGAGAIVALMWGLGMFGLQRHFAGTRDAGEALSGFTTLIANGSDSLAIAPGWIAATFFALALLRLRRGSPEPPITRGDTSRLSATDLRARLRREYRAVGIALLVVACLAVLDAGRAAVLIGAALGGDTLAHATVGMVLMEAAGLFAASVILGLWAHTFRLQLEQLGAL